MRKFNVVVEDQTTGLQHKKEFSALVKSEAENLAIKHFAEELFLEEKFLEVLVSVEVILDQPLDGFVWIKQLKKGDKFIFNGETHTVRIKWRNDENKPLVTEDGSLFHWEELNVQRA